MEYTPGELFVKKYIRAKYARQNNSGVVVGSLPVRPLEKHLAGEGLLTQILIDKYVDHLPLHRQIERFKRQGVNVPSSTMSDWVKNTCNLIEPLYAAHVKEVLASNYLHVDETPIKVLAKEKKATTHRGYFWVYQNSVERMVVFDYREGRGREGPLEMLRNFVGYLQVDGYGGYDIFEKQTGKVMLACMAHARRMFIDALGNDRLRAEYVLDEIQKLYAIETEIKNLDFEERKQVRQNKAVPILNSLQQWMEKEYTDSVARMNDIAQGSDICKALAYCLPRWEKLSRYTEHGMLNIDNNPVENSIRPVALGRKNYLFCGSHESARRTGMFYSLFGTCKMQGLNPSQWLREILCILPNYPVNHISELLPQHYRK